MKISIKIFSILIFASTALSAQTNPELNKEVEVIKDYQPSISDAYKITSNPVIRDTNNYTPSFLYNIYSSDIEIDKNINHFPVVKLSSPPRTKSNTGYAKAAIGNALTPYGELVINTSPAKNTDFGVHFYHFSSRPNIKLNNGQKVKAPYSNNMARIFMKNYFRKSVLEWDVNYKRNRINYYGFPGDTTIYNYFKNESDNYNSKQAFNNASASLNLHNINRRSKLDYNVGLKYNYFWNTTGQSEHHAGYNGLFTRRYRTHQLVVNTEFDYYLKNDIVHNFDPALNNHQFFNAKISPEYHISKDIFDLRAGANISTLIGADSTLKWHISPKIYFAYHPIKGVMTVFAGTDGGFKHNSYSSMVSENPYTDYNTDLKPSEEVIQVYGGFKGKISRRLSYLIGVNYSINQNEALYYQTNKISVDSMVFNNMFTPVYDDINRLKFGGKFRFSGQRTTINLEGNYYIYSADSLSNLPHLPAYDASLDVAVSITDKINATAGATVIGKQNGYVKNIPQAPLPLTAMNITPSAFKEFDLDTAIDISLGAEYKYSKNMYFYLNANNLLNQNYQRWNGYNQQGLLILLGARIAF